MLYGFVDTNIFIELKSFDEIDWNRHLEVSEVCLVISQVVLNELDKLKTSSNQRPKRRAKRILSGIERFLDSVPPREPALIRPGVYLRISDSNPQRSWLSEHGYDPDVNDDRVVGAADFFRTNHPEFEVMVIAHDYGVRHRARSVGLDYWKPPDDLLENEPKSPLEKENEELKQRLAEFQDIHPSLEAGFRSKGKLCREIEFKIQPNVTGFSQQEIEYRIHQMREALYSKLDPIERSTLTLSAVQAVLGFKGHHSEIERYLGSEYRDYLEALSKFRVIDSLMQSLSLVLRNSGKAPAEDIDVRLIFPQGVSLSSTPVKEPEIPTPPEPSNSYLQAVYLPSLTNGMIAPEWLYPQYDEPEPRDTGPDVSENAVKYSLKYLKQHDSEWEWPPIYLFLSNASLKLPTAFEVKYEIKSASLPTIQEDRLLIRFIEQ